MIRGISQSGRINTVNRYAQASVSELAKRCQEETIRFLKKKPGPVGACFELFRRAVAEKCQEAWEAVHAQYRDLMLRWAGDCSDVPCDAEDVAQRAFEKLLKAVKPETFARFAGIESVLAYLRRCVTSVHIDRQRIAERERLALAALRADNPPQAVSPEDVALERIVNGECAARIYSQLKDERERLVAYLNLELGLKPKEIVCLRPDEFPTERDVYRVRERVVRRLSQDPILRDMSGKGK
jgi:DNA-directed RNA polymerase specialized sigma24 family protein